MVLVWSVLTCAWQWLCCVWLLPLWDLNDIWEKWFIHANLSDWWLRYLLWNHPEINFGRLYQWNANNGTGNGSNLFPNRCWPRSMSPYGVTRPRSVGIKTTMQRMFNSGFTVYHNPITYNNLWPQCCYCVPFLFELSCDNFNVTNKLPASSDDSSQLLRMQ